MAMKQNLIGNLNTAMARSGITITQLADAADLHRTTLSRIIHGKLEPSLEVIEDLARTLQVDPPERLLQKNCFGAEIPLEVA